jgi:hypothetical protein
MTLRDRLSEARSRAPRTYEEGPPFSIAKAKTPEYERWWAETFESKKIVPTIEHPGIEDAAPLRRFMDLPKFLDLIISGRLLLPRLAELKRCDPHECDAKPDYSQVAREELERRVIDLREFVSESATHASGFASGSRYASALSVIGSIEDRVKRMSLDDLTQAAWFAEHSRLKKELVCSCWYGGEMESDAMWRLYCEHVGVAITTSISRLKRAVSCFVPKLFSEHFKLSLEKVTYKDTTCSGDTHPWLIKRRAFRHEDEVRLYVDYPFASAPGFDLLVDPRRLIQEVTVTPYAQKWQSDLIEATFKRVLGSSGHRVRLKSTIVKQSTHMDASDPIWPESNTGNYFSSLPQTEG